MRVCRLTYSLLICVACACSCLSPNAAGSIAVEDLIPDLSHFVQVAPEDKESRAKLFAQLIIQPHPEIYQRTDIFKTDLPSLELYLDGLTAYLAAINVLHARFEEQRESIETNFLNLFPDFDSKKMKICLMLSLFRFDGKIPHDNPRMLLLGMDGLAKFHGQSVSLPVIVSHELFHLYHFQVNPLPRDTDYVGLYRLVWQEGLATYVSQVLNPGTSLSDILLDPRLANEGPRFIPAIASSLQRDLNSTDDATAGLYLSYRRGGLVPSRMGYLIGYEIARKAAADHSLVELTRLRGEPLSSLVRSETAALATGASQASKPMKHSD
jgi:hypothetical protein